MASCRHVVKDLAQPSSAQPGSARRRFLHPLAIDRSPPSLLTETRSRTDQIKAPHTLATCSTAVAAMATRYWIVSLPVQSPGATASSLWSRLQDSVSRHSFDTPLYRVG